MAKHVVVKQAVGQPEVPLEVIAQSVKAIAQGVRSLRRGPMNEAALLLLIQHATKNPNRAGTMSGRQWTRPSVKEIKAVLDAMESLESQYLRRR